MTTAKPRQKGLRKHLISLLGKEGKCLEQNLKARVRAIYADLPASHVDSEVETLLLELIDGRILQIDPDSHIVLTELGRDEYRSILDQEELKQKIKREKRVEKAALKQKKQGTEQKKAVSRETHEKLKRQLGELAFLLGKTWKPEHELVKGGPVVLDLVWYANPYTISHAFEVQHRGDWKNAIGNLEAVGRHHPNCRLFLVVYSEKPVTTIQQLLGAKLDTSIKLLRASQLQDWISALKSVPSELRPPLIQTVESIVQVGLDS